MRRTGLALVAVTSIAEASPDDLVARRLVLDEAHVAASLMLEVELADGARYSPISLAPDLWYGLTRRWTIGLVHSNQSVDRIAAGASVCIRRSDDSCDLAYHGGGVDVRWAWRDGALAVAPRTRFLVRDFDPWKPALTAGALARWTRGRFAITADPYLQLGIVNRDLGNRATANVPIWLAVQPTCRWLVALHTGIDGELATWRDGWHVPVGLVVQVRAVAGFEIGLEAGFPSLLGPQNDFKRRALMLGVTYRGGPVAIGR
ncbi:MAG: hypothetical protein ABI867_27355 [Kofleriaceae bacterium]